MSLILVTGGCGFIGSHTCIELKSAGYDFVILDNLSNARKECLRRMEAIMGTPVKFVEADILNPDDLDKVFQQYQFKHVIHFAALKAVGESTQKPLEYYKNNVAGTLNLLEAMRRNNVFNFVFSSSATVYGEPKYLPIDEKHPIGNCTNPYGKSKYFIEEILADLCASDKRWNVINLRYFNPVGAHLSGLIGEDPQGIPNNLLPYISQVAVGKLEKLKVFGNDYPTPDGTGVRDYIHVVDLAKGHVSALYKIEQNCGLKIYNLGTGRGYSVLEMAAALETASGKKIAYEIVPRRPGDTAACYSDCKLAEVELGWKAERGLKDMCEDLWRWQSMNPNGFATPFTPAKSG